MRKILIFILTILHSLSYAQTAINVKSSQTKDCLDWICVPGIRVGPITSNSTEKDLIRIYGKRNVVRSSISIGEGNYVVGTLVFPNKKNELQITWTDTINFTNPDWISIQKTNTKWKTNSEISVGTSLKELEKINGKEFIITGFGWDYGGTVIDWNGGKLDSIQAAPNEYFIVRFDEHGEVQLSNSEYEEVLGDKGILSSDKILQKLNPKVHELLFFLKK